MCIFNNAVKAYLFLWGSMVHNYQKYFEKYELDISDNELPTYSILLPVRHEGKNVLKSLLTSIYDLDYPKDRLDVKLIIDADDVETIGIGKELNDEFDFDLIIVPETSIKSKPISCNYALDFVEGKFVTIYDAEDRPERYQLKKAVECFCKLGEEYICLQASLNYYNKYHNFITYCFSIEYSMWFDFTIRAIPKFASFFPLGGTSNHFKTAALLEIGKWDGYNVTEDAEIAIRIVKAGYRISCLNSITEEECVITIPAWIRQRTRWIKGFMQTFIEHSVFKKPIAVETNVEFKLVMKIGIFNIMIFIVFIAFSFWFFLSTLMLLFDGVILRQNQHTPFVYFNIISLFIMIYGSLIFIVIKNKIKPRIMYLIFFPMYWILHYVAMCTALYELMNRPFFWDKTTHGVSS